MAVYSKYHNSFFISLLNMGVQALLWVSLNWHLEAIDMGAQFALSLLGILISGLAMLLFYMQSQTQKNTPSLKWWGLWGFIQIACFFSSLWVLGQCITKTFGFSF